MLSLKKSLIFTAVASFLFLLSMGTVYADGSICNGFRIIITNNTQHTLKINEINIKSLEGGETGLTFPVNQVLPNQSITGTISSHHGDPSIVGSIQFSQPDTQSLIKFSMADEIGLGCLVNSSSDEHYGDIKVKKSHKSGRHSGGYLKYVFEPA